MAGQEEKDEAARAAFVKKQAEASRAKEEARRAAHKEAAKRAYAESLIQHGPLRS